MLLALYIALDVLDPSIPGIFFFDSDELFVDTVVDSKAHPAPVDADVRGTAEPGLRLAVSTPAPARADHAGRESRVRRTVRRDLRDDPSRGPDSAPSDDH